MEPQRITTVKVSTPPRSTACLALSVLLSAALSGCGGASRGRPATAVAPAPTPDELTGVASAIRAEDVRRMDEGWERALSSDSPRVRRAAIRAAGAVARPETRSAVERALDDPSPEVRAAAVVAWSRIAGVEGRERLITASADPSEIVRAEAVAAAGALDRSGEPHASVVAALSDASPGVRTAAIRAASATVLDDTVTRRIAGALGDADDGVRSAAIEALARIGSETPGLPFLTRLAAREALLPLVGSSDWRVRRAVARGLRVPTSSDQRAALGELFDDADVRVRAMVARAAGYPGAPIDLLRDFVTDEQARVAVEGARALGFVGNDPAIQLAALTASSDRRPVVREAALLSVVRSAPETFGRLAPSAATDGSPLVRRAVARSLDGFVGPLDRKTLLQLKDDVDASVRAATVVALSRFSEPLLPLLGYTYERASAQEAIGLARAARDRVADETADPAWREEAVGILEDLWARRSALAAVAADRAIVGAALDVRDRPRAAAIVDAALDSEHYDVRIQVAGRDARPPAARPDEIYEDIARWSASRRAAIVTVERPGFRPARFTVRIDAEAAPLATWSFAELAESGAYDGTTVSLVRGADRVDLGGSGDGGSIGFDESFRGEAVSAWLEEGDVWLSLPKPAGLDGRFSIALASRPADGYAVRIGRVVQNLEGVVRLLEPYDRITSIVVYDGDGSEPLPPLP